jgi:cell division protein FtsZ
VLLSISGGSDLGLFEINEAASLVSDAAHADANIIFGAVIDDALGDEVRVTVIAAGFDNGRPSARKDASTVTVTPAPAPTTTGERLIGNPAPVRAAAPAPAPVRPAPAPVSGGITVPPLPPVQGGSGSRRPLVHEDFEEELDIPEFLRST